jgi:hypothetical protein
MTIGIVPARDGFGMRNMVENLKKTVFLERLDSIGGEKE